MFFSVNLVASSEEKEQNPTKQKQEAKCLN